MIMLLIKVKSDSNVPQKSFFKLAWRAKELEQPAANIIVCQHQNPDKSEQP